jgi:hypothetical protein
MRVRPGLNQEGRRPDGRFSRRGLAAEGAQNVGRERPDRRLAAVWRQAAAQP